MQKSKKSWNQNKVQLTYVRDLGACVSSQPWKSSTKNRETMWTKSGLAIILNHKTLCIRCLSSSLLLCKKNHYEVLEIPRAATPKDIRKAFLKKSKEVF